MQGFRPSTFNLARHDESRFPLRGSHATLSCSQCHRPGGGSEPKHVARYRFEDRSCSACHQDPHRGQFQRLVLQKGAGGTAAGCQTCHSETSWNDIRFAHTVDTFPLQGKHSKVACIDCHKPPRPELALKEVDFASAPRQCEGCHKDYHLGQFAGSGGVACAPCHSSARWSPSSFDHNRRTRFPLLGKHGNVKCGACHKDVKTIDGQTTRVFQGMSVQCSVCHQKPV